MMIFPFLAIAIGLLFVLFYFMRKGVTYLPDGHAGSIWMGVLVFAVFAIFGYFLDGYIGFSTIPTFMLSLGGIMATYALIFLAGFILLCIGMLIAEAKCGRMVA
jgi:hypothetical protein